MKRNLLFVFVLLAIILSCQQSTGSNTTELPALNQKLASLSDGKAKIPESIQNSKDTSSKSLGSRALYDSTGQVGVMAGKMWDLMYNHLADLSEEGPGSPASIFLQVVREVATDSQYSIASGKEFSLGMRSFPNGWLPPSEVGATNPMDFGKMIIEEDAMDPDLTHIYWMFPFTGAFGEFYIEMEILELNSAGDVDVQFWIAVGDSFTPFVYQHINNSTDLYESYMASPSERNVFKQYTDSNGILRTFFNASCNEGEPAGDEYELLFFMMGNDSFAGVHSYSGDGSGTNTRTGKRILQQRGSTPQCLYSRWGR